MDRFTREDVMDVLRRYGISSARRADNSEDETEEIILLADETYARVDIDALTRALIDVLPHKKVAVIRDGPRWPGEPI